MVLNINNDVVEHLSYLCDRDRPVEVLRDFCKLAKDFINKGPNLKLYNSASQKLNISAEHLQNIVESLVYLLTECCRHKLSDEDFKNTLRDVGFNEETHQELLEVFKNNMQPQILEVLESHNNLNYFHDLQWRFETKIGSRALLKQTVPLITMNLKLSDSKKAITTENTKNVLFQTDPNNLLKITDILDKAHQEAQLQYVKKTERKLKKLILKDS